MPRPPSPPILSAIPSRAHADSSAATHAASASRWCSVSCSSASSSSCEGLERKRDGRGLAAESASEIRV
eukprot:4815312-Pleurochrysis_carterae.AAC.1